MDEMPEMPRPQAEHEWLQQMVGEWTVEFTGTMGPDQPEQSWSGTESVRSLGGFWVIGEGRSLAPGMEDGVTISTIGYDPQQRAYVGTFIGSMMSFMWLYKGALDADKRVLTLDTDGPNMAEPEKLSKYQDIMEIVDQNHRILRSQLLGPDGQWHQFMTAHYRRVT